MGDNKKLNFMGMFLFILLGLTAPNAFAQEKCLDLFITENTFELSDPIVDFLWDTTQQWNDMVGSRLRVDEFYLTLTDGKDVTESNYHPYRNEMTIGAELDGRSPQAMGVIMAHEFGHVIFTHNFSFTWKGKKVIVKNLIAPGRESELQVNTPGSAYRIAVEEKLALEREIATLHNHALTNDILSLQEKLNETSNLVDNIRAPHLFYSEVADMIIAYEELFADCIPVIIWRDPYAVLQAGESSVNASVDIEWTGTRDHNVNATMPRTFLINDFRDWKHEKGDKYTLFDPVRGALWNLFLENLREDEIPLFLKTFLEASSLHIGIRLDRNENIRVSAQASNPTKINQEFLKIFVATARKYNLPIRRTHKKDFLEGAGKEIFNF